MDERVMDWIQRDLDGDLSDEEKASLEAVLKADPEMQLHVHRLRLVSAKLAQLPKVNPPYSLVDAILPQLTSVPNSPAPQASAKEDSIPRLERRAPVASTPARPAVHRARRILPVWLARLGTGVIAASLLFGILSTSHRDVNPETNAGTTTPVEESPQTTERNPEVQENRDPQPPSPQDDAKSPQNPLTEEKKTVPPKENGKKQELPKSQKNKTKTQPSSGAAGGAKPIAHKGNNKTKEIKIPGTFWSSMSLHREFPYSDWNKVFNAYKQKGYWDDRDKDRDDDDRDKDRDDDDRDDDRRDRDRKYEDRRDDDRENRSSNGSGQKHSSSDKKSEKGKKESHQKRQKRD